MFKSLLIRRYKTKTGLDLQVPAMATLFGGVIGSFFDKPYFNEHIPHMTIYAGSLIGGVLGSHNSVTSRKKVTHIKPANQD